MDWSRPELIAVLAVAVAIVGTATQILTISNQRLRRFLLLVLVIIIATAVRLVIVGGSPHASEPASLPPAGSPNQPNLSPEPSKQAVPLKAERGQPPSPPIFQPPPPPVVPSKAAKAAESIQNAIVGDWTSDNLLAADIHFTEDGEFTTVNVTSVINGVPVMEPETGAYKFIGDSRIEIRFPRRIFPDEVAEWDLAISGNELRVSVVSGFGRGATYHRKS